MRKFTSQIEIFNENIRQVCLLNFNRTLEIKKTILNARMELFEFEYGKLALIWEFLI